jgi:hypothetical protein
MSTSSEQRHCAATAAATVVINPRAAAGGVPDPDADHATHLAAAEAQAAASTTNLLRAGMERQPRGSRSPTRRHASSPSPECSRGRGGCHGSPAAIQTTYKDSSVGAPWSMLTRTDYHEWRLLMKVKMQARPSCRTTTISERSRLSSPPSL